MKYVIPLTEQFGAMLIRNVENFIEKACGGILPVMVLVGDRNGVKILANNVDSATATSMLDVAVEANKLRSPTIGRA